MCVMCVSCYHHDGVLYVRARVCVCVCVHLCTCARVCVFVCACAMLFARLQATVMMTSGQTAVQFNVCM